MNIRRIKRQQAGKRAAAFALTLVCAGTTGLAVCQTVYGASPEFARTEQEWQTLQDNVIEYEELEDLIHEYNPTVQNNLYEYRKFREDYGETNEEVSEAYRDLADDLYGEMSGESEASSMISDLQLEIQAKNMLKQADQTLEDSKIYLLTYEQAEKNLAAAAQSNMISYYGQGLDLEKARMNLEQCERNYQAALAKQRSGIMTEMDVLSCQKAIEEAQNQVMQMEQTRKRTRESLQVSLGRKVDDQLQFGPLPEVDLAEIDALDPQADLTAALENNYVLQINKRKLENSRDALTRENMENTIANNEKKIASSLNSIYGSVLSGQIAYEEAVLQNNYDNENLKRAQAQMSVGIITADACRDYEVQAMNSRLEAERARMELLEAMETYSWALRGLAAAE